MTENDRDLVRATLDGDPDAFGTLIDKYEKPLFNAAYRITGSVEDAMDATQSAFVSAYENLSGYDPKYRFFSWVYRIAVNASLDIVKRRREAELPPQIEGASPDPEHRAVARETSHRVQEALMELTPEQRTVIVLRHFQGLSYDEMAEVTGVPAKTVKSRLYEGRQTLRTILEGEFEPEER